MFWLGTVRQSRPVADRLVVASPVPAVKAWFVRERHWSGSQVMVSPILSCHGRERQSRPGNRGESGLGSVRHVKSRQSKQGALRSVLFCPGSHGVSRHGTVNYGLFRFGSHGKSGLGLLG